MGADHGPWLLQLDLDLVILSNIDTLVKGYENWVKVAMYWHPGASFNPTSCPCGPESCRSYGGSSLLA